MRTNFQPVESVATEKDAIDQLSRDKNAVHFETNHVGICRCGENQAVVSRDHDYQMIDFRVVCSTCGD